MTLRRNQEFIFQLFALLLALIVVHSLYVAVIRPQAAVDIQAEQSRQASEENYVPERSFYVVLKDYEQESCFVLMLWAMAIMGFKARRNMTENRMLSAQLLPISEGTPILAEDARQLTRPIQALPEQQQQLLLPRALLAALHRFSATGNVADVSAAINDVCDTENDRLDSELSMVRYIAWAIPSIGFIGTVRGIGDALAQAHRAVAGDIAGVTQSLGVAFNSTFIALVISILVMFLMHQLQLMQERLVLDTHNYCDRNLVRHLLTSKTSGGSESR